jgi:citronellol/citronellal dehydrogenase
MASLKGRTVFITGATRGIGEAIALRCARDGANVVITGKTVEAHGKLKGTIHSVAHEVEQAGGRALALQMDVRDDATVEAAVAKTVETFGGIDVLVNNASAISLSSTLDTSMKRFDLMFGVNVRGTFGMSRACIPMLRNGQNPHILNLGPPLNMSARWFKDHTAYTMSKYGMSMCTLGMSAELALLGIAVNSLWPRTTIATAAIEVHFPPEMVKASRTPEIMADAAHAIFCRDSRAATGNFYIDEDVLRAEGVVDFGRYAVSPGHPLQADLFID